ncbi:MAG: hypothetical protein QG670_572 [Thermoproteota archaeon]|nr:hypothetical protein [Thermoproteota archaeon]
MDYNLEEQITPKDFVSSKAKRGRNLWLEGFNTILGETIIGNNCLIGLGTVIGYPSRSKLVSLLENGKNEKSLSSTTQAPFDISKLDKISKGATIGNHCIIRGRTWIYEEATLGNNIETGHNVMIREGVKIGDKTKIGTHTVIDSTSSPEGKVDIGKEVSIQTGVYICYPSEIGNNVFIGPHVILTNDKYPPSKSMKGITLENGVIIGANSTLIAGVTVGADSMVAAASVVTKDIPKGWVAKGNPAKKYMTIEEYRKKQTEYEKAKTL